MIVAGLMSGTSADAIDVAIVNIRGQGMSARMKLLAFHSSAYSPDVRSRILAVASGELAGAREISQLNFLLGELFAKACLAAWRKLRLAAGKIQLIGSHGQTIYHQAAASRECGIRVRSTLQIAEPAIIAARTGIPTVADFRPADIAVGGQGAPLVPFFDYVTYRHPARHRIALNIGGIANLTFIPAGAPPTGVRAFDTGPGNMVMDQLICGITRGRLHYDRRGQMAFAGQVDEALIRRMLKNKYFRQQPPKSTGRELFGEQFVRRWFPVDAKSSRLQQRNALATATAFTAASIADAIQRFVRPAGGSIECFVSGGGVRNDFLMDQLSARLVHLPIRMINTEEARIPSRAKEAAAFALLAYQTFHGEPSNVPAATGARRPTILGKLVRP